MSFTRYIDAARSAREDLDQRLRDISESYSTRETEAVVSRLSARSLRRISFIRLWRLAHKTTKPKILDRILWLCHTDLATKEAIRGIFGLSDAKSLSPSQVLTGDDARFICQRYPVFDHRTIVENHVQMTRSAHRVLSNAGYEINPLMSHIYGGTRRPVYNMFFAYNAEDIALPIADQQALTTFAEMALYAKCSITPWSTIRAAFDKMDSGGEMRALIDIAVDRFFANDLFSKRHPETAEISSLPQKVIDWINDIPPLSHDESSPCATYGHELRYADRIRDLAEAVAQASWEYVSTPGGFHYHRGMMSSPY